MHSYFAQQFYVRV
jgi:hypothetical protein